MGSPFAPLKGRNAMNATHNTPTTTKAVRRKIQLLRRDLQKLSERSKDLLARADAILQALRETPTPPHGGGLF